MEKWIPENKEDINKIISWKLKKIKKVKFSNHALSRMRSKRISKRQINEVVSNFRLLDCNNREGDLRVVLESSYCYSGKKIVVIISLNTGELITCYKRKKGETRQNINLNIAKRLVS